MPTRATVEAFIADVTTGRFVEAMEAYYRPDATAQENNDPPRVGLEAMIANERRTLAMFASVRAQAVGPALIEGDRVAINWIFEFDHPAGIRLRLDEIALQVWQGDRIASERFYYDPRQLQPGS